MITGKFTARVRSTTGGYVFTGVCLSNFQGGYPIQLTGGVSHSRSGWGGVPHPAEGCTPSYLTGGGGGEGGGVYPILGLDRGGTLSQVWTGWVPPQPGLYGVPPWPGLDGVPPWPGLDGVSPPHPPFPH